MPGKVAFLFLVLDDPHFPRVWDAYLAGTEARASVYIHAKHPERGAWRRERVIADLRPTAWGRIVEAELALFAAAMADPANAKFLLVSESCLPVKPFAEMYARLTADAAESFVRPMRVKRYDLEARLTPEIMGALGARPLTKHYARACLSRPDVRRLLYKYNAPLLRLFAAMPVGDEFFLTTIAPMPRCTPLAVVFDDWASVEAEARALKARVRALYEAQEAGAGDRSAAIAALQRRFEALAKSPKTFSRLSRADLRAMARTDSFFYRKFARDSDVEAHIYALIAPREPPRAEKM